MRRRRWRGHLSPADQAELWRRWRQGEPLNAIARALDRRRSVVSASWPGRVASPRSPAGAVRGCCPWRSARRYRAAWRSGTAAPDRRAARARPSTVCRELGRHGGAPATRYGAGENAANVGDRAFGSPFANNPFHLLSFPPIGRRPTERGVQPGRRWHGPARQPGPLAAGQPGTIGIGFIPPINRPLRRPGAPTRSPAAWPSAAAARRSGGSARAPAAGRARPPAAGGRGRTRAPRARSAACAAPASPRPAATA